MEEQLVAFKTAILAKEKGFRIYGSVNTYYYNDEGILSYTQIFSTDKKKPVDKIIAFTQSLLQKWLREEHCLYVTPQYNGVNEWSNWFYEVKKKEQPIADNAYWLTYEEALEEGLYYSLKQIK